MTGRLGLLLQAAAAIKQCEDADATVQALQAGQGEYPEAIHDLQSAEWMLDDLGRALRDEYARVARLRMRLIAEHQRHNVGHA